MADVIVNQGDVVLGDDDGVRPALGVLRRSCRCRCRRRCRHCSRLLLMAPPFEATADSVSLLLLLLWLLPVWLLCC